MISDGGRRTGQLWAEFVVNEGLSEENPERWWEEVCALVTKEHELERTN